MPAMIVGWLPSARWGQIRVFAGARAICAILAALLSPSVAARGQQIVQPSAGRYGGYTPGRCAMVPRVLLDLARRDHRDVTPFTPTADTLPGFVADSLRLCDAAYEGFTREERELLNEARVKLALGGDSEGVALQQQYLDSLDRRSRPARERAWAFFLVVTDDLDARPPRVQRAREALAHLDALDGAGTAKARILAHRAMALAALRRWDDSTATSESLGAIRIWRALPDSARKPLSAAAALSYLQAAEVALRTLGGDSAKALIDSGMSAMPAGSDGEWYLNSTHGMYAVLGKAAAPIEARFWFNDIEQGATRPAPGHVSIISDVTHFCGAACRDRYDAMARFQARFGSRGLDIINTTRTFGFFVDTAPVTPEQEAKYDSAYFLGELRVPGVLGVAETKFSWLADGRRHDDPTAQDEHYPFATFVIVDKHGLVRYAAFSWDPLLEEPLARFLERLLTEP